MRTFIGASLLAVLTAAAVMAQEGDFGLGGLSVKNMGSAGTAPVPVSAPQTAVSSPEHRLNESRKALSAVNSSRGDDTDARLYKDTDMAIKAYEYCFPGTRVSYKDPQNFASIRFYMNSGSAKFNPDGAQTRRVEQALDAILAANPPQARVIFEALIAAGGNVTLAMGSLAEIFCNKRARYLPHVRDMDYAQGKNYYRFAGMFIGLHPAVVRAAGGSAAYGNIVGNPIVYAGAEIVQWWGKVFAGGGTGSGVDTLHTMGPDGNGNLVDKIPELNKGMNAAARLRKTRNTGL
ncbi:MAG: hypothetical protein NTY45_12370 [Elusimicrobia bacterium]|nr:hypothetical protein [Elusimicrobiota bacterium]